MAIDIASILKSTTVLSTPRILIHGVAGVGKTTFAAGAPKPVFVQTEDGLGTLEVPRFPLARSFDEVMEALAALYTGSHDFETVVVDSVDWLEPLIWQRACRDNGWASIEDAGYGKGYVAALELWRQYLEGLNALRDERGMTVIQTAHTDIKRFDSPEHEPYDRYVIKLHARAAALLQEHSDVVLFANYRISTVKADIGFNKKVTRALGSGERVLYTVERPAFLAKNRYGLPDNLPLSSAVFAEAMPHFTTPADNEDYIQSQKSEGWILVGDRYDDGGYSGGTMERPALQRLLRDVESGVIDVIVVYKVDRLSRSLTDFARIVEVFEKNKASFVSITQQFNTTSSMGRLTLNILLSFAQFEREVIGERIRDKFAASRRKGMWMGGMPPLGYDVRDRKLVMNEKEAELVRLMFNRFLRVGSATKLAQELHRAGHTTKTWVTQDGRQRPGKLIDKGAIYKILNNRVYLGEAVHKGTPHPGEHEAIIDRATWDKVHAILAENTVARANGTPAQTPALLKGLIFAPGGRAMTPSHSRKNGRLYRYYVSSDAIRQGYAECPVRSVPAAEVEEAVVSQVRLLLQTPEIIARTWAAARDELQMPEREVVQTVTDFAPLWDELFPAEQARIVRLLVERVDLSPDGMQVRLRAEGLQTLVEELRAQEAKAA